MDVNPSAASPHPSDNGNDNGNVNSKSNSSSGGSSSHLQISPAGGLNLLAETSQDAVQEQGNLDDGQVEGQRSPEKDAKKSGTKQKQKAKLANGNEVDTATANTNEKDGPRLLNSKGKPVRRRISRACDQCNQLRTKCDGNHPCAHCVEADLNCEYARERKKRGKASRKDMVAQAAAANSIAEETSTSPNSGFEPSGDDAPLAQQGVKRRRSTPDLHSPRAPPLPPPPIQPRALHPIQPASNSPSFAMPSVELAGGSITSNPMIDTNGTSRLQPQPGPTYSPAPGIGLPSPTAPVAPINDRDMTGAEQHSKFNEYARHFEQIRSNASTRRNLSAGPSSMPYPMLPGGSVTGFGDDLYGNGSPPGPIGMSSQPYRTGDSPLTGAYFRQSSMLGSPRWPSLPSPSAAFSPSVALNPYAQQPPATPNLRYPVLRPLLRHVSAIIPVSLACDLLELYFSSTSSAFMQPQSPYILGYVFRKRSFLRQDTPRVCSPALLASMLWIAAQTSEAAFLTSAPAARGRTCQKLLELTVSLLKPLVHTPQEASHLNAGNTVINGVALGGFGMSFPGQAHDLDGNSPGAAGSLDDVATYIHLATVVSASEYKAASLRWWNSAWSLARELKLGIEQPPNSETQNPEGPEAEAAANGEARQPSARHGIQPGYMSEEEREERRRIWWLLYSVDRHLALCYNRPLFLLDVECEGLLQPEQESIWQAGEYYPEETYPESRYHRRRGPCYECTGHSIFGYFLPLMSMLGEILDLHHARSHPRLGSRFRESSFWDDQIGEISHQLEGFGQSLQDFASRNGSTTEPKHVSESTNGGNHISGLSQHDVGTNESAGKRMTEATLQTKIVVAYSTHLMHTLYILLNGKWDPISLLDDNDLWISSQSFISATGHAVSAAEAINEILDYDPDLSFMPFFFGIYLLQGSFLLLLIADKLQTEASPSVVKACETIVRAHEACVVTLNTEYQRNFRKVMRSALAQVRGRTQEDFGEQQLRRREVLSLYRWTGNGTGLAL